MWVWARRWGYRAFGIVLCAFSWMLAVGLYSLGEDWFYDIDPIHGLDDLLLNGIVQVAGETLGAVLFFLIGFFGRSGWSDPYGKPPLSGQVVPGKLPATAPLKGSLPMKSLFTRLALIATMLASLGQVAHATADGPDAWRVYNVAAHDHLNARVGPGTSYFVIDALPYNARQVQIVFCTPTTTREQYFALSHQQQQQLNSYATWCLVNWNGYQRGWVNRRFLTEDGS